MQYKMSKSDWNRIGIKAGWIKIAQSEDYDYEPDRMDSAKPPEELDPSFEEDNSDWESSEFSYLTESNGHAQYQDLMLLRHKADELLEKGTDEQKLHKAIYWALQAKHIGGLEGSEYAVVIGSSPVARELRGQKRNTDKDIQGLIDVITKILEPKWL